MKIKTEINVDLYVNAKSYHDNEWSDVSNKTHIKGIELADNFMSLDLIDMKNGTYKFFGTDGTVNLCNADEEVSFSATISLIQYIIILVNSWYVRLKDIVKG